MSLITSNIFLFMYFIFKLLHKRDAHTIGVYHVTSMMVIIAVSAGDKQIYPKEKNKQRKS